MKDYQEAMLKSLVAVAWADGRLEGEETEVIDALLQALPAPPARPFRGAPARRARRRAPPRIGACCYSMR